MALNVGRILFVDNQYGEAVQKAVTVLVENGMTVQFWNGQGELPSYVSNIRVVIVDLDLADLKTKTNSLAFYSPILTILRKIPGPLVVTIMAQEYEDTDPGNLSYYYEQSYGPFKGVILDGVRKDEEIADPNTLLNLITSSIRSNKILKLLLTWETVVDKAQDKAFDQLISSNIKETVPNLVRSLCRDFSEDSAARELVSTIMQLVSRRMYEPSEFQLLDSQVKEINKERIGVSPEYPCKEDLFLYNRLMFYEPSTDEPIWTGDIYRTKGMPKYEDFGIVLTPVCDLANNKTSRVLLCFGFPIVEEVFGDPDYPPYKFDFDIVKKVQSFVDKKEIITCIKNRYLLGKLKNTDNFYTLWNLKLDEKTIGVCFDFNNIQTINAEELKKWHRIQRLDFPFKQHILETYGRFMSRVGTAEINKSPDALRERLNDLKKIEEKTILEKIKKLNPLKKTPS